MKYENPAPRTHLELDVSVKRLWARKAMTASLKNVSLSGAFLELPVDGIFKGDMLKATFVIAKRERTIALKVVWKNEHGLGVKFMFDNHQDILMIDDLLYFAETRQFDLIRMPKPQED
ncbi:PilZ domain-containing protein [Bdellovibrio sp. qaytius]|nr:PilZ domain-containing protein [Bdellovibrio sp. qaytius]